MPPPIVVSSVGGNDGLVFGEHVAAHVGFVAFAIGLDATKWGWPSTYNINLLGYNAAFDFTLLAAPPPGDENFPFGPPGVLAAQGADTGVFGGASVSNAAQSLSPLGFDAGSFPVCPVKVFFAADDPPIDFDFQPDGYAALDFTLGYRSFHFGASVTVAQGFDAAQWGATDVEGVLGAHPGGWDSLTIGATTRISGDVNGRNIEFNFLDLSVNPPNFYFGGGIVISAGAIAGVGVGVPSITTAAQTVSPAGFDSAHVSSAEGFWVLAYGARLDFVFYDATYVTPPATNVPFYFFGARAAAPDGHYSTEFGTPTVETSSTTQTIEQYHYDPHFTQWGLPSVLPYGATRVYPAGVAAPTLPSPHISHFLRWLYQTSPYIGPQIGELQIRDKRAYVTIPPNNVFTQFGLPVLGQVRSLGAAGATHTQWGTPDVDWLNVVRPTGIVSTFAAGNFEHSFNPQRVYVAQTPAFLDWGREWEVHVYNSRQYVGQVYDPDGDIETRFGTLWVANRNKEVKPFGHTDSRFSNATIVEPAGTALYPVGREGTQYGVPLVAHRVRYLYPPGIDKLYINPWHAVWNYARVVAPTGIYDGGVGRPNPVWSNKQFITTHTPSKTEWGTAFVAPAVRSVEQFQSQDSSRFGLYDIAQWTHKVYPGGISSFGTAAPTLIGPFFRTMKPASILAPDIPGPFRVWNKTPNLYPQGFFAGRIEYQPVFRVEFRVRSLTFTGAAQTQFGQTAVKDRKQTVYLGGWLSQEIPLTHDAFREGPDPPSTRIVAVTGWDENPLANSKVGHPKVQGPPYLVGNIDSMAFGTVVVRLQGCIVAEWAWPDSQWRFGIPSLNRPPVVSVQGIFQGVIPRHRVSPHTIWCTEDTPPQAVDNHPEGPPFRQIDAPADAPVGWAKPFWGTAAVSNQHRAIYPSGQRETEMGTGHFVRLKDVRVLVEGFKATKFGWPSLPSLIEVYTVGFDAAHVPPSDTEQVLVYRRPGSIQIIPFDAPTNHLAFGAHEVQNWIRNIYPPGGVHTQWGNNTPMVHFPRHVYTEGADCTQWGRHEGEGAGLWVSHRNRAFQLEGWDSFEFGLTPGWFWAQMRVTKRGYIRPAGISEVVVPQPTLTLKSHRVFAYMIPPPTMMCNKGMTVGHA